MNADLSALLPVVAGAVIVAVLVVGFLGERKRRERLMRYCQAKGWTYVGTDDALVDRFDGEPFGRGDNRSVGNVITGQADGRPFTAFDYAYETHGTDGHGRRTTTKHRYAVHVLHLPVPLGEMSVVPESVLSRMATAVGLGQDIELESDQFNRRFRVRASDPKLASDVLHPRTMEFLLAAWPGAWRIDGADMIAWEQGRIQPGDILACTATLACVAEAIPAFVWKDRGYDPRS